MTWTQLVLCVVLAVPLTVQAANQIVIPFSGSTVHGPVGNVFGTSGTIGNAGCWDFIHETGITDATKVRYRTGSIGATSFLDIYLYRGDGLVQLFGFQKTNLSAGWKTETVTAFTILPDTEYRLCVCSDPTATSMLGGAIVGVGFNNILKEMTDFGGTTSLAGMKVDACDASEGESMPATMPSGVLVPATNNEWDSPPLIGLSNASK